MERLENAVSVIHRAHSSRYPLQALEQGTAVPDEVFNASWFEGMSAAPVIQDVVQRTEADYLVPALYDKIVRYGDLSTLDADLGTLSHILAGNVSAADGETSLLISNVHLGKALNILCQLVRKRGHVSCDSTLLQAAACNAILAIRARTDFTLENLSVIMFHLGELINHPKLQEMCSEAITKHLLPIFEATLHQLPEHAVTGACLAFGMVSALRASEQQMVRPLDGVLPRPAVDTLLLTVPALLRQQPGLLVSWETRTLALVAKYGVQYLRRLGQLGRRQGQRVAVETLQLNAARALKPIIEEARLPSRGVWDQRDGEFHGFGPEKQLRDYLAYSTKYYCEWLGKQKEWIQQESALQEAARGPLPDNTHDGRNFAEVVRAGVIVAPTASAMWSGDAAFPTLPVAVQQADETIAWGPATELVNFSIAARELLDLKETADRDDRERAITATNALVVAIVSGRITLDAASRVQMLLHMDGVCMRLHLADPFDAPQYEHQMEGMCAFMSSELCQMVDRHGRTLLGDKVGFKTGLSSYQRTLLEELNKPAGEG
jgi:hypothetical protein